MFSTSAAPDQAVGLRRLRESSTWAPPADAVPSNCRTLAFASGKGGVGKSVLALNLAIALAERGAKVCLVDANMGLGNLDLLLGLNGYWNLAHVLTGARTLPDVVLRSDYGVDLVPGASGLTNLSNCPDSARARILQQLSHLEARYDFLLLDTSAGIHWAMRQFILSADEVNIVTTPEPTAMADAYGQVKHLGGQNGPQLRVVVNQSASLQQGEKVLERIQQTAGLFLGQQILRGEIIPHDPEVADAVMAREPSQIRSPDGWASRAISRWAAKLYRPDMQEKPLSKQPGTFFTRVWHRFTTASPAERMLDDAPIPASFGLRAV